MTTDRRGNLLVVDNRGSAVVTFSAGGRLLARFGTRGTAQHQFAGPHYVAVDSQDRVVVTDFHNHSVKVGHGAGQGEGSRRVGVRLRGGHRSGYEADCRTRGWDDWFWLSYQ